MLFYLKSCRNCSWFLLQIEKMFIYAADNIKISININN